MTTIESRIKTWEIILPRDLCEYVEEMIANKRFTDADSLIASALHAFRDVAAAGQIKHERLKADLRHAIDQAERGELLDGEEVFDRHERELQEVKESAA